MSAATRAHPSAWSTSSKGKYRRRKHAAVHDQHNARPALYARRALVRLRSSRRALTTFPSPTGLALAAAPARINYSSTLSVVAIPRNPQFPDYFLFNARRNTVSSAAFTSAYSAGARVPAIFSLSTAKSSSLSAFSRAALLSVGDGAKGWTVPPSKPGAGTGLRSRKAAAAAIRRITSVTMYHLYFVNGSGVAIGAPRPPPGPDPGAPASGCWPACAPCSSRGIDPVPEMVNSTSLPGTAFLATNVWMVGS